MSHIPEEGPWGHSYCLPSYTCMYMCMSTTMLHGSQGRIRNSTSTEGLRVSRTRRAVVKLFNMDILSSLFLNLCMHCVCNLFVQGMGSITTCSLIPRGGHHCDVIEKSLLSSWPTILTRDHVQR